uniref:Uncharacterized protein n=1 Tax=Paracoccus denitrificans TaxID=266 RepID=Q51675_PARDE|nr:unknown [Paracoccus denitrificans]
MAETVIAEDLRSRGFTLLDPPADQVARIKNPTQSNGSDSRIARDMGAHYAISGEVQKVSNLILSLNLYIRDAESGDTVRAGVVDIRGNTDESFHGEPYRSETPATLAGAQVIDAAEAMRLHAQGVPFIDVLPRTARPEGLPEARFGTNRRIFPFPARPGFTIPDMTGWPRRNRRGWPRGWHGCRGATGLRPW